jgi:hypothetical protein
MPRHRPGGGLARRNAATVSSHARTGSGAAYFPATHFLTEFSDTPRTRDRATVCQWSVTAQTPAS